MSNLADLNLKPSYHKGKDDIAKDFYLPCMSRALTYDRAVGYFNSSIYIIAWPSLKNFVNRGGKMRLICSPVMTAEDRQAIDEGYHAQSDEAIGEQLKKEIESMLNNNHLSKPAKVLASLVAMGVVDIKIAFFGKETGARHKRLFHDKVGVFTDTSNESVVFKGSMNETWAGLSLDGNLESVDVFVTWEGGRDEQRSQDEIQYFNSLWNDEYPTVSVTEFPKVAHDLFVRIADVQNWERLVDEVSEEIALASSLSADRKPDGRRPRPHQLDALLAWMNQDRRGVLEHATGSGKTFTALCAIRDALENGETPIILVPSELLLYQWSEEIKSTFDDLNLQVLLCGAGNTRWRTDRLLRIWTKPSDERRIVISTMQTASSTSFSQGLFQGEHLFLVADEVHRMGSTENRKLFKIETGPRLGLSATPRRAGDPVGSAAIFDYFGEILQPPFTLADAISSKALTPYMYYVHKIYLSEAEQENWDRQTSKIKKIYARSLNAKNPNPEADDVIKRLLIERSKIVKRAEGKIEASLAVMQQHFAKGQRWIVYCDSQEQLYAVQNILRANGIEAGEYHSQMRGDREQTLRHFEVNGGILVSIRCLDEGVDIPSVTHALILASSKNPREFIQRRGRVLRRALNKPLAFVHDTVVIPKELDEEAPTGTAILEGEMSRAIEFGSSAENPSAITELKRIALKFDIDYEQLALEGYEDDEEE